jgi:cell wall-associated NlpC family hydrolase
MASKDHVKGTESHREELLFRDGSGTVLEVMPALVSAPKLTETIDGASYLELEVFDPDRKLLRKTILSQKWDAEIDGMHFRYPGALTKNGRTLTLTLEDRWIALLREKRGPKRARRGKNMTRAEFIKGLVEEAAPGLKFYCPQLRRIQPIKNAKQGKAAAAESRENLGKGIAQVNLTVEGQPATKEQKEIANRALEDTVSHGGDQTILETVMVALMDESHIGALTSGKNVLQAEGAEGAEIGGVEREVTNFLTGTGGYGEGGALGIQKKHPNYTPPEIATTAQRNAAFLNGGLAAGAAPYARFSKEAKEWVEAFGGEGAGGSIDLTEPFLFEVKKREDYWTAIKRLAKEVNWRAFTYGDKFFYMPEPELFQGEIRLAIDEGTPGVEFDEIGFTFDGNQILTEVTVPIRVKHLVAPPGSVVTIADCGPVSLSFGNAKEEEKGARTNNLEEAMEGNARYLVSKIELPLDTDPTNRIALVTLKKPTHPLPEKAATKHRLSIGTPGAAGNATVERMLAAAERISKKNLPYIWGGFSEAGYDCSGFVSKLLDVGGFFTGRTDTQGLAAWGEAGAGEFITVYIKTTGSPEEEHTAIEIAGDVYESGGGSENGNPNGGPGKVSSPSTFLKQFDTKRHPRGF